MPCRAALVPDLGVIHPEAERAVGIRLGLRRRFPSGKVRTYGKASSWFRAMVSCSSVLGGIFPHGGHGRAQRGGVH